MNNCSLSSRTISMGNVIQPKVKSKARLLFKRLGFELLVSINYY